MADAVVIDRTGIDRILLELKELGYRTVGPTVRNDTILYDGIDATDDLPVGLTDEQAPGSYRISRRTDDALFGYVPGPDSWKKYLHPQEVAVWTGERTGDSFETIPSEPPTKHAFIGVRPCELAAIAIHDKVFLGGTHADAVYEERRGETFLVAVNCTSPGGTCFCVSMETGPGARDGYDIVLTEVLGDAQTFVAKAGSEAGATVLATAGGRPATDTDVSAASALVDSAVMHMGRTMETAGLPGVLAANQQNPYWNEIATRCLACTNCTMVCPTCFCASVEDRPDLDAQRVERIRTWDSCFSLNFSAVHGGPVRSSTSSRYRQWMTHKLSSWHDQFGMSGCVGCGRCITWCPVAIDITQEARAIRASDVREAHVSYPERR